MGAVGSRVGLKVLTLTTLVPLLCPASAAAQESEDCRILCTPELNLEPTLTVENLFARPRVAVAREGGARDTVRLGRDAVFEAILAVDIPTQFPRVGLTLEAIWPPFEDGNELELEGELNIVLLTGEETGGWVGAHFDIVDQFSPAERPNADRAYTHKLDFELDVAIAALRWLPERNWLRHLEVEGSLDYLATGLPRRGEEVDGEQFLDDASGWSVSVLMIVPLAPLAR